MTQPAPPVEIEPELRGPTPRPLRFQPGTQRVRLFLPVFCCALPVLLWLLLGVERQQLQQLARGGRTTEARVTAMHVSRDDSDGFEVDYTFPVADREETGTQNVSRAIYERTRVGDPITITYLPAHPGLQRLGKVDAAQVAEETRLEAIIVGPLAVIFLGVAGFLEWYFRRQLHLLRNGVAVCAEIVSWSGPGTGRYPIYYFTYEYATPDGERISRTIPVNARIAETLLQQQRATVLYNPRKPRESNFYLALDAAPAQSGTP